MLRLLDASIRLRVPERYRSLEAIPLMRLNVSADVFIQ